MNITEVNLTGGQQATLQVSLMTLRTHVLSMKLRALQCGRRYFQYFLNYIFKLLGKKKKSISLAELINLDFNVEN